MRKKKVMIVKGLLKDNTSGKKQEGTLEKEEEPTDEEGKGESNGRKDS